MNRWIRLCAAGVIGISLSSTAVAEQTTTLNVSARSIAICSVSTASLRFADYRRAAVNTSADIRVVCTQDVPYVVGLGSGLNPMGGNSGMRQMSDNADDNTMQYQLYLDASLAQAWGDECVSAPTFAGFPCKKIYNGDGDGTEGEAIAGTSDLQTHTVYGEIPAGQVIPTGNYFDAVVVTFVF